MDPDELATAPEPAAGGQADPAPAAIADPAPAAPAAEPSADAPGTEASPAQAVTPHTAEASLLETATEPTKDGAEEPAADPEKPAEGDKPAEPEKPAEEPKAEEKPAEEKVAEPPAPEPIDYSVLAVPEGLTVDAEKLGAYTEVLREAGISPEVGQRLINMHADAITAHATDTLAQQHSTFAETRKGWRTQVMGDEQLGGAAFQTVAQRVAQTRDRLVPAEHRDEFNEFLRVTGAGDHPALWRLLDRAAKFVLEPVAPTPAQKPAPNGGGPKGRIRDMYTHPTSVKE